MDVCITGSHGYIGSHLRKTVNADWIDLKIGSDILDHELKIDASIIVHLAALVQVGESVQKPLDYYQTNINGTINLLDKFNGEHFIFASTGAVDYLNSPYALSKKACEEIIVDQCKKRGINYTIFRFYNIIGSSFGIKPTNPDGLFYALCNAANNGSINIYGSDYDTPDGTCIRDYVHVMEICNAIKAAIDEPSNSIECLGHGNGYSVLELTKIFQEVNNVDFDINFVDRRQGDIEKSVLKDVSKYMQNQYTIEEMLKID